jgi:hypothetical protein
MIQPIARMLLATLLGAIAVGQQTKSLDGHWWQTLDNDERVQFLAGFIDCYVYDFGDRNNTFPESWYTYAPRITQYYQQPNSQVSRSVTSVLFDIRSKHPAKPLPGGETWTNRHGFFNGEYWREITPDQRVAFIEGYLACYREHLGARRRKFSKPAGTYAENISRWFGINGDDMNTKLEDVAIADALYKYADRQQAAK